MQDFISDMIIRIKNGYHARLGAIFLSTSSPKICLKILEVLKKEGYIRGFVEYVDPKTKFITIKVLLKYDANGVPAVTNIFRVSTPSRKYYLSVKSFWKPKSTSGFFIVSTPKGILIDRDARLYGQGGEVICGIY